MVGGVRGGNTKAGLDTVHGQAAVVLVDAGGVPGSIPSKLWVATSGPALPLRLDHTAPGRPGGRSGPCRAAGAPAGLKSSLLFSGYNVPVNIDAPVDAVSEATP